jgi:hypothetical protein
MSTGEPRDRIYSTYVMLALHKTTVWDNRLKDQYFQIHLSATQKSAHDPDSASAYQHEGSRLNDLACWLAPSWAIGLSLAIAGWHLVRMICLAPC